MQIEIPEHNSQLKYTPTLWIKNHCGYTRHFYQHSDKERKIAADQTLESQHPGRKDSIFINIQREKKEKEKERNLGDVGATRMKNINDLQHQTQTQMVKTQYKTAQLPIYQH